MIPSFENQPCAPVPPESGNVEGQTHLPIERVPEPGSMLPSCSASFEQKAPNDVSLQDRVASLSLNGKPAADTAPATLKPILPWNSGVTADSAKEALIKLFNLSDEPGFQKLSEGESCHVETLTIDGQKRALKISKAEYKQEKHTLSGRKEEDLFSTEKGEICALDLPEHPNIVNTQAMLMLNTRTKQYHLIHSLNQIPKKERGDYRVRVCIQDLVKGKEVFEIVDNRNIPFRNKLEIVIKVCESLSHLHDHGLIYRDVKPENIIYDQKHNTVTLVDLGLCKPLRKGERTRSFSGTPQFLAPEVVLRQPYDYAVDNWALGLLICEVCFGKNPVFDYSAATAADAADAAYLNIQELNMLDDAGKRSFLTGKIPKLRRKKEVLNVVASLIHSDPAQRMPLSDASSALKAYQQKIQGSAV